VDIHKNFLRKTWNQINKNNFLSSKKYILS
jgi:hypothetical protein